MWFHSFAFGVRIRHFMTIIVIISVQMIHFTRVAAVSETKLLRCAIILTITTIHTPLAYPICCRISPKYPAEIQYFTFIGHKVWTQIPHQPINTLSQSHTVTAQIASCEMHFQPNLITFTIFKRLVQRDYHSDSNCHVTTPPLQKSVV